MYSYLKMKMTCESAYFSNRGGHVHWLLNIEKGTCIFKE